MTQNAFRWIRDLALNYTVEEDAPSDPRYVTEQLRLVIQTLQTRVTETECPSASESSATAFADLLELTLVLADLLHAGDHTTAKITQSRVRRPGERPERKPAESVIVGVGVVIPDENGKILVGKRKGSIAPYYSIPGGQVEQGETFQQAAIREIREETGLIINDPRVIGVTNNLDTFVDEGLHTISVVLLATNYRGDVSLNEPELCEGWTWVDPSNLPEPHFEASSASVRCYREERFYHSRQDGFRQ